jgi:methyltransferase (TIGR00027 family)
MTVSRTAQGVARARARMTRPATSEGDHAGEELLNRDLGAGLDAAPGPLFHHLAARTRFFDELTLGAVDAGIAQVVIVGAGYDCRALRFRRRGVRFFELDHPSTQHDKQERLARLGVGADDVTYVAIDLVDGDVANALAGAGQDAARPTLFSCEGLLLYLNVDVVERLFAGLRRRAETTATLAMSLAVRDRAFVDPVAAARRAAWQRRLRELGEPPRTRLRRAEWDALLTRCGWIPERAVDPHDLDPLAMPGGALLMTAVPVPVQHVQAVERVR